MKTVFRVRSAGRRTLDGGHGPSGCRAEMGRLLIPFPCRPGIAAAVSRFLFLNGMNITESQEYPTDPFGGASFLQIEFNPAALAECLDDLAASSGELAGRFSVQWQMTMAGRRLADRLIAAQNKTIVFT